MCIVCRYNTTRLCKWPVLVHYGNVVNPCRGQSELPVSETCRQDDDEVEAGRLVVEQRGGEARDGERLTAPGAVLQQVVHRPICYTRRDAAAGMMRFLPEFPVPAACLGVGRGMENITRMMYAISRTCFWQHASCLAGPVR